MTKLVRKLKQLAKKRAHRKTVQKRREARAHRDAEQQSAHAAQRVEDAIDAELQRLRGEDGGVVKAEHSDADDNDADEPTDSKNGVRRAVRMVGGLVLDVASRGGGGGQRAKKTKALTRRQQRRREKLHDRGEAFHDALERKLVSKRRRVKVRAQIRNEELH